MGIRRKTRHIMRCSKNERGMLKISQILKQIPVGSKVAVNYKGNYQTGLSHRRFQGRTGTVKVHTRRNFYHVLIGRKMLITTGAHLIPLQC